MNDLMNVVSLRGILEAIREDIDDTLAWDALADWGEENGLDWNINKGARPVPVILAACEEIATKEGKSRIECIGIHTEYMEPGYTDPQGAFILTGDWNKITRWDAQKKEHILIDGTPELLSDILEKLGCALEWEDEWATCDQCGGLVRTQPDGMSWTPHYVVGDGEFLCLDCHGKRTDAERGAESDHDEE